MTYLAFRLRALLGLLTARPLPDVIILPDDTLDVMLMVPIEPLTQQIQYQSLQRKVQYYEGQVHKLHPDELIEVRFEFEGEPVRMVSVPNDLRLGGLFHNSSHILLRLYLDGPVRLFAYEGKRYIPVALPLPSAILTGSVPIDVERFILQRPSGLLWQITKERFRQDMQVFFEDCRRWWRRFGKGA